ncbi:excalibur calcium-binding domain-containing protein [Actinopolymorpha pittospori]
MKRLILAAAAVMLVAGCGGAATDEPAQDKRYDTCGEAVAAGLGPYTKDEDPEYAWYDDNDGDGVVCES